MHSVFFELFYFCQSVKGNRVSIHVALVTQQYMCLSLEAIGAYVHWRKIYFAMKYF